MRPLLFSAILSILISTNAFAYSGGTGEPNNPYQIATKQNLLDLAGTTADYGKCFILTADVNMEGQVFTSGAIIAAGGGTTFTGTFDGNGHKVTHFTINAVGYDVVGLFGCISSGSSVENLGLENFSVSGTFGSDYVGGLVGNNSGGSISNCYSTGAVTGGHDSYDIGGLVGGICLSSISNCYSTGTVNGGSNSQFVGGLVGCNGSSISNCYSTGAVSGGSNSQDVGGLVGGNSGSVSNCYSTGTVSGYAGIGGLVGWSGSYSGGSGISISDCYSTGPVSGTSGVGGLVGGNNGESISNCYSTSAVTGGDSSYGLGGLVGWNEGDISNCYSMGAVSGYMDVGGLVGGNDSGSLVGSFWDTQTSGQTTSAGGTGKTTAQMKTLSTFTSAEWNFVEIWGIGENQTYPYLMTESAGDLNHDKKVDFADFAILAQNWLSGE